MLMQARLHFVCSEEAVRNALVWLLLQIQLPVIVLKWCLRLNTEQGTRSVLLYL